MNKFKFIVKRFSYTQDVESFINSFTHEYDVQDVEIAATHSGACKEIIVVIKYMEK